MKAIIAPSILSADFGSLASEVEAVVEAGCDWIHIDVMDGHFVPNLTMGSLVVDALRKRFPTCTLDVHLMVERPELLVPDFVRAGADIVTIHAEATLHVHRALQMIRDMGVKSGLAFNPASGLDPLAYVSDLVDLVLIMTVNPGFGGQKFIRSTLEKIESTRTLLNRLGCQDVDIEVDGGINEETIVDARRAGANVFVAGSAVFSSVSRALAIEGLKRALDRV